MVDTLGDEWWLESKEKSDQQTKGDEEIASSKSKNHQSGTKKLKFEKTVERKPLSSKKSATSFNAKRQKRSKVILEATKSELDKKKKKKNKRRKKKLLSERIAEQPAVTPTSDELVSFLNTMAKDRLSAIEMPQIGLLPHHFGTHRCPSLSLEDFFKDVFHNFANCSGALSNSKGSPEVLILCISALRAVKLRRVVKTIAKSDLKIAKLFAKHLSVSEQSDFLAKNVTPIGVGTANRVSKLIEEGSLHISNLEYVLLDWTHRDNKLQRLIDQKQSKLDLFQLFQRHIIPHLRNASCKLVLM